MAYSEPAADLVPVKPAEEVHRGGLTHAAPLAVPDAGRCPHGRGVAAAHGRRWSWPLSACSTSGWTTPRAATATSAATAIVTVIAPGRPRARADPRGRQARRRHRSTPPTTREGGRPQRAGRRGAASAAPRPSDSSRRQKRAAAKTITRSPSSASTRDDDVRGHALVLVRGVRRALPEPVDQRRQAAARLLRASSPTSLPVDVVHRRRGQGRRRRERADDRRHAGRPGGGVSVG